MAGVEQAAVELQVAVAVVARRGLERGGELLVRGEPAVHGPLARVGQQQQEVVELAVEARQKDGSAVI